MESCIVPWIKHRNPSLNEAIYALLMPTRRKHMKEERKRGERKGDEAREVMET
jgi:hypothetical protein